MYRNDSELIQACLQGKETAWHELVGRYARLVYSVALGNGLAKCDADDVFQNVFTIAFRRLDTLRDHKLLAAWLITITSRESQRFRRHFPLSTEIDESLIDPSDSLHEDVEIYERQHLVRSALDQLEPRCRELLYALFLEIEQPSYLKIATRLGIPAGSIGPTRARCFKKLEAILVEMDVDLATCHNQLLDSSSIDKQKIKNERDFKNAKERSHDE